MARAFTLSLLVLLPATIAAFGQTVYGPGQSGYPGQNGDAGIPAARRTNNPGSNHSTTTLSGMLRTLGDPVVVIDSDDHLLKAAYISHSTRYIGASGGDASIRDFQPGDRVAIDANQDSYNNYRAITVTLIREASPNERLAASQPIDIPGNSPIGDDIRRPSLRRAGSNPDDSPASGTSSNKSSSPAPERADPFLDRIRKAAFSFSETLPNYVVKQYTTRYATADGSGSHTSWQALDTVTADVIEENGNERYKNFLVNGKAPREDPEKTGSWSRGEFSSLQLDVLSPLTKADFHGKRATTVLNRAAYRYDFSVERPNSHWRVDSAGQSYLPAYAGSIWVDKENFRVLRIETTATNLPESFPLDKVESAIDYDYVFIGESKYLLPVHSEALSCERGTSLCSRNVIEFRNYRKFVSDASITFDPGNH